MGQLVVNEVNVMEAVSEPGQAKNPVGVVRPQLKFRRKYRWISGPAERNESISGVSWYIADFFNKTRGIHQIHAASTPHKWRTRSFRINVISP